jgi:preprotein translocase subunit Sec61beta
LSTKREKRRRDEAPMPAASAGLLRFFEEDTPGIKLSPQLVVISGIMLVALALLAYFLLPIYPNTPTP